MNLQEALTTLLETTLESDDATVQRARKRVAQKVEALRLKKQLMAALLQARLDSMRRVSGDAECEICHRTFKNHPYFNGHKIDDGTGRRIPWLREDCKGGLVKL